MGTLVFLLIINVVILATWTAIDPREWTRTNNDATDVFNRPVESYGSCNGEGSLPYVIVLLVINFLFLFLGNWYAYLSRNIETEYLESRYVNVNSVNVFCSMKIFDNETDLFPGKIPPARKVHRH